MGFEQDFRVLADIPEIEDGRDHEVPGIEILTNRPVVIHFLAEKAGPEQNAFLRKLLALGSDRNHYVLVASTWRTRSYIVTLPLPGNIPLREWAAREPGEFTKRFLSPVPKPGPGIAPGADSDEEAPAREMLPLAAAVPVPADEAQMNRVDAAARHPIPPVISEGGTAGAGEFAFNFAGTSSMGRSPAEAGEFTRRFGLSIAPENTPENAPEKTPQDPPPGREEPIRDPGEFTRRFGSLKPDADSVVSSAPHHTEAAPGEFTRRFGPLSPADDARPAPFPSNDSAWLGAGEAAAPGTFDQMNRLPVAPPPAPDPIPSIPGSAPYAKAGEFTRIMQMPAGPPPGASEAPGAHAPASQGKTGATGAFEKSGIRDAPVEPAAPREPGKYTREFEAPAPARARIPASTAPAVAEKPPTTDSAAVVRPETSYTTLVLGLVIFLLIALLIVVIFALRK